jgi:MFS family permease
MGGTPEDTREQAAARGTTQGNLLAPLAIRDFRLLWVGESVSIAGTQLHMVALPWVVLQLTGSGLALGTVMMASAAPRALLMLFGGVATDRYSPRAIMIGSNVGRGILVALLALLVATARLELWHLYGIVLLFGAADAFSIPHSAPLSRW